MIQAFGEEFEIIFAKKTQPDYEILQCRSLVGKTDTIFLHISKESVMKNLLPHFYSLMENSLFEDYRGCFTKEGELYLAFYKREGAFLAELLGKRAIPLERKLDIIKLALEKILLWKLPNFLAAQLLDTGRILVNGNAIAFDYGWETPLATDDSEIFAGKKMRGFLEQVFRDELSRGEDIVFREFCESFTQGGGKNFLQIYEQYDGIYDKLFLEKRKHVGRFEALKIRMQGIMGWVGKLAAYAALALLYFSLLGILLLGIFLQDEEEKKEEKEKHIFQNIGTLEIRKEDEK